MRRWTREQRQHLMRMLGLGKVTVPTVYESIGADFFAAPAPGFLNLGLWNTRPGNVTDAPAAARRLVRTLAEALPEAGDILDVANGLGAQDPIIADTAQPRKLVAVNITERQLHDGADWLLQAGAMPVAADASRLPIADRCADGLISVEAAFHFPSRAAFLHEAARVLRPGGVLAFSDVTLERTPKDLVSLLAGLTGLRFWGMRRSSVVAGSEVARLVRDAGFVDVRIERCGHRTIDPFVEFVVDRLASVEDAPAGQRIAGRVIARQWAWLRRRGIIDYVLVTARLPLSRAHRG